MEAKMGEKWEKWKRPLVIAVIYGLMGLAWGLKLFQANYLDIIVLSVILVAFLYAEEDKVASPAYLAGLLVGGEILAFGGAIPQTTVMIVIVVSAILALGGKWVGKGWLT